MSEVYKAYDSAMDRFVAIKFMRPELITDSSFQTRFEREAKISARLKHKNIIPLYDFGKQDNLYYLVMEYIRGGTLKDHLSICRRAGYTMPLSEMISMLGQIGEALDYAHKCGIVHRDVKPDNVLIAEDGRAMLNDFGLAKILDCDGELTLTGMLIGTPHYMPPERIDGDMGDLHPASDIYSLGIILYEMVTGKVPFAAKSPILVLLKHLKEPIPAPSKLVPNISAALEQVILKALEKDPGKRYQVAGTFLNALKKVVSAQTLTASFNPDTMQKHA